MHLSTRGRYTLRMVIDVAENGNSTGKKQKREKDILWTHERMDEDDIQENRFY